VKTFAPQRQKWTRLLQCLNCPMFAVRLWITTSPYRWPVGSLPSTCMLCTPPALHKGRLHPTGTNSWSAESSETNAHGPDGRIILKWNFKARHGLIWLRMGWSDRLLLALYRSLRFHERRRIAISF
jgi:hypothetical protein